MRKASPFLPLYRVLFFFDCMRNPRIPIPSEWRMEGDLGAKKIKDDGEGLSRAVLLIRSGSAPEESLMLLVPKAYKNHPTYCRSNIPRGPTYGNRGKVVLAFEENGSSKIGVRFDRSIPEGNDLGGLCEEDRGFFCAADLLRLESSSADDVKKLVINELFEVTSFS
ncbi:ferredoxin-dependent glutamate synthase chloroplastic [Phtheirospermum japonicum]|uniref:Ferredoxin-dependent glutamate synthase chloroplastic n=1 Tax=Phtheirospermum japonicum TaxID=374723 RepID=A0A830DDR2_9LAMI|nr:ferredoxin-dependent glutamate synthase chloroplastic [Phtheirospermum japonicum]